MQMSYWKSQMARPPARISRSLPAWNRKPNERVRPKHRAFINGLPCCVTGKAAPSECAHVRSGTDGGTGIKPSDKFTVPLAHAEHARQHRVGEARYWSELGVDPLDLASHLWTISGDQRAGERAVFRFQQAIALKR
jgi:hypothetical protein